MSCPITHQFCPTIYPRKLWIIKGGDEANIKRQFLERDGSDIVFDEDADNPSKCTVFTVMHADTRKFGFLVWMQVPLNVESVAHEASHVAMSIFNDVGAGVDPINQEPFAYLVGWVADCIWQVKTGKFRD